LPQLTWRTALVGCAGTLLPLPLALLMWLLVKPPVPTETQVGSPIGPMLTQEQRSRLSTYRRECGSGSDCEPPLGCLYESRYRQAYCTDSQCMTDAQCPEGQVCRPLATKETGPLVRLCIPVGVRQEGESCNPAPKDKGYACAAGLVCGGKNYSWCARPCRLSAQVAECPEGFFCADTVPEAVCLPTCEGRECPEGQSCVRLDEGASTCAHVYGAQCQHSPCPEEQACRVLTNPPHPGKAWMECIERCGKGYPACGTGKVCDVWQCLPGCEPQAADACGEGYRCGQPSPDRPSACRPDW
jgi:hypothetical protein